MLRATNSLQTQIL